jgi:hypothetical protein
VQDFPLIGEEISWKVGSGTCVRLGEEPWVGCGLNYTLPGHMVQATTDISFHKLS